MSDTLVAPSLCQKRVSMPAEVEFNHGATVGVSGDVLFSRYVFPCGWEKLSQGIITRGQWQQLLDFAITHVSHDEMSCRLFMGEHFVTPFQGLFEYGQAHGRTTEEEVWSYQNVSEFWRAHEGHALQPDCAVISAICPVVNRYMMLSPYTGSHSSFSALSLKGESINPIFDEFELRPGPNDIIFFHKRVIAEVERER